MRLATIFNSFLSPSYFCLSSFRLGNEMLDKGWYNILQQKTFTMYYSRLLRALCLGWLRRGHQTLLSFGFTRKKKNRTDKDFSKTETSLLFLITRMNKIVSLYHKSHVVYLKLKKRTIITIHQVLCLGLRCTFHNYIIKQVKDCHHTFTLQ